MVFICDFYFLVTNQL